MVEKSHKGLVKKKVTVKRGGKTFERYQWVKAGEDEPEPKKGKKEIPKSKGSFNIGDSIKFMGKDLKVEKVSESEKTVKLSDGKVYTFDAIDKGMKFKKPEASIKDLKAPKKKSKKEEIDEKISINKSELSKAITVNAQVGEAGYALIPRSYDKEKRQKDEDNIVKDIQKWLENQQDRLEDELKKMYPEL